MTQAPPNPVFIAARYVRAAGLPWIWLDFRRAPALPIRLVMAPPAANDENGLPPAA